ncbi:hypothetical protein [Rhodoferax sp. GW822-FHT02A01]|uniref:hypothetical protein n=1 Tax=Rhodoferax sp. GW822-FHT02A01 TaxID=3141537 RepID=UPI00315D455B
MRVEVTPHTLAEIAEHYEAALAWVAANGFPVDRGRHAEYRRTIKTLLDQFTDNGWGNISDDSYRDRVCTALLESRELVSIYRGLSTSTESAAIENLQHYIKGPVLPTQEQAATASNKARNFGFELYLNALFAHADLHPEYSTKADLSFLVDELRIFVEAKRPTSGTSVETSLRIAIGQLTDRLCKHEEPDRAGIVALDLSKVINPENRVMLVRDEDHLYELMYAEDKLQMDRLLPMVVKRVKPGVVGIILHYRLLTTFESTGSLNTLKWLGWIPFLDEPRLTEMNARLQRGVRTIC